MLCLANHFDYTRDFQAIFDCQCGNFPNFDSLNFILMKRLSFLLYICVCKEVWIWDDRKMKFILWKTNIDALPCMLVCASTCLCVCLWVCKCVFVSVSLKKVRVNFWIVWIVRSLQEKEGSYTRICKLKSWSKIEFLQK